MFRLYIGNFWWRFLVEIFGGDFWWRFLVEIKISTQPNLH
jgi:hypothetical protein